jgi:serine/threonine-protein kinase RsbW
MTIPALQQPIALTHRPATAQNAQFGAATPGIVGVPDDAEAIVSEFVANAVRHARSPAGVALIMAGGALIIITADSSREPPAMSTDQDGAESGRGLVIVDAITGGQWGWSTSSAGKSVWASLRLV